MKRIPVQRVSAVRWVGTSRTSEACNGENRLASRLNQSGQRGGLKSLRYTDRCSAGERRFEDAVLLGARRRRGGFCVGPHLDRDELDALPGPPLLPLALGSPPSTAACPRNWPSGLAVLLALAH